MRLGSIDFGAYPIFLAPMEDVTDSAFRRICRHNGATVVSSEFISSDAVVRSVSRAWHKMKFLDCERPFCIQLFGGHAEVIASAAEQALRLNPDIIDINFGCPVYKIIDKGAGAACLRDIRLMEKIARCVVKTVNGRVPVTVKTRLGWDDKSICIEDVAYMLQDIGISLLAVHARTRCQKYKGVARWEWLRQLKSIPNLKLPIIGNGDICTPDDARYLFHDIGLDGIMIGRAAIGNPWIFSQCHRKLDNQLDLPRPSFKERINMCIKHLRMAVDHHGEHFGLISMKKHYGHYFSNISGAKLLRSKLMTCTKKSGIEDILAQFINEGNIFCDKTALG